MLYSWLPMGKLRAASRMKENINIESTTSPLCVPLLKRFLMLKVQLNNKELA